MRSSERHGPLSSLDRKGRAIEDRVQAPLASRIIRLDQTRRRRRHSCSPDTAWRLASWRRPCGVTRRADRRSPATRGCLTSLGTWQPTKGIADTPGTLPSCLRVSRFLIPLSTNQAFRDDAAQSADDESSLVESEDQIAAITDELAFRVEEVAGRILIELITSAIKPDGRTNARDTYERLIALFPQTGSCAIARQRLG